MQKIKLRILIKLFIWWINDLGGENRGRKTDVCEILDLMLKNKNE